MDNLLLTKMASNCCANSKMTFAGVWSADNFTIPKVAQDFKGSFGASPTNTIVQSYQIINTAKSQMRGEHWLLVIAVNIQREAKEPVILIWDCLGAAIQSHVDFFHRLKQEANRANVPFSHIFEINFPLQTPSSNLCGLYCLYVAHYLLKRMLPDNFENFVDDLRYILQPLKTLNEMDLVLFTNSHCQVSLKYRIA